MGFGIGTCGLPLSPFGVSSCPMGTLSGGWANRSHLLFFSSYMWVMTLISAALKPLARARSAKSLVLRHGCTGPTLLTGRNSCSSSLIAVLRVGDWSGVLVGVPHGGVSRAIRQHVIITHPKGK